MLKLLVSGLMLAGISCVAAHAADPAAARSKPSAKAKSARQLPAVAAVQPAESHVPLSADHLEVAQRVVLGKVPCELGAHVSVSAHETAQGRFVLEHGRQKFHMVPVLTSTGAIRLEDAASGAVWLQLANKSMLMDQKQGRRLADACMNAEQVTVADAMARSPAPHLLEPLPSAPAAAAEPAKSSPDVVKTATN